MKRYFSTFYRRVEKEFIWVTCTLSTTPFQTFSTILTLFYLHLTSMQKHQRPKVAGSIAFVAKSRKSVPFNYSFRSDWKVRELVNGFQSELIEDTLGKNKHSSGFEIKSCLLSIIDTPPVGSGSKKASCQTNVGLASTPAETMNDPSIYFHFDTSEDIDKYVVKKKRTYSSTGPLSISPSQKKSKCQPANVSKNPCSTGEQKCTVFCLDFRIITTILFLFSCAIFYRGC